MIIVKEVELFELTIFHDVIASAKVDKWVVLSIRRCSLYKKNET